MSEISAASPDIEVKVDGSEIGDKESIVRLRITQSYDGPNQAELEFVIEAGVTEHQWSADGYAPGKELEISMGHDAVEPVFKGVISRVDGMFGDPSLNISTRGKVVAYCKLHFLSRIRKTMHWEGVPYSDVIDALASEAGISAGATATTTTFDYVSVNSQNWLSFATELARRVGYRLSYEDDALVFAAPEISSAVKTLKYGTGDLIKVKFKADTSGLHDEVHVLAYDDAAKAQIIGVKTASDISHGGTENGVDLLASKFTASPLWITNYAARTQAEVDELAQALMDDIAFEFCTCEGELTGDPTLKAGTVITIEGVTPNFMGDYYLTQVVHDYNADVTGTTGGGYRTRFTGMRQFWGGV